MFKSLYIVTTWSSQSLIPKDAIGLAGLLSDQANAKRDWRGDC